jgi:hypothetical protein
MPSKLETGIKEEVKFYLNEIQERNLTKKQISDITDALMVNDWLWETVHSVIENTAEKILKTQ